MVTSPASSFIRSVEDQLASFAIGDIRILALRPKGRARKVNLLGLEENLGV
jgi:hypothetical protein